MIENITISTGRSAKDTRWRRETMTWQDFCHWCRTPKRTRETYEQYCAYDRDTQGSVKDVGGFVAAVLSGPRRKRENVTQRTAVTLDIDDTRGISAHDVWLAASSAVPAAAMVAYTTHKHCKDSPRLRIIVPLSRPVNADTYEPVARMAAKAMGVIDICDPTTFAPERLFFWPSASADGEFLSWQQEGEGLDPVEVLGMYRDKPWNDAAAWPRVPGEDARRLVAHESRRGSTLEDPLAKEGLIGAFCRAHSPIDRAIDELLPDVYTRGMHGRYTLIGASTANGLVLYDLGGDGVLRWAHSNHSTDKARDLCCNIWDLCRIHRFGHLDDGRTATGEKLPSYKAMCEYASEDPATKLRMLQEKMDMFNGVDLPGEDCGPTENPVENPAPKAPTVGLADRLQVNKKTGEVLPSITNILTILEADENLSGLIGYNEMSERIQKKRAPFWGKAGVWTDRDDACLRIYMERVYGINAKEKIYDAILQVMKENAFHPVRDWLLSLPECAGAEDRRCESVFIDYLGAEDTPLNRAVSRKTLVAAVARVMDPGCKFDYCLTLMGREGIGKSTIFRAFAGDEWFTDSVFTLEGKEAMEQIMGAWIVELAELSAATKTDLSRIKQVLSQQVDRYRSPYGRRTEDHPRQYIFVATTNEENPLKGDTGNRRFWLMPVGVNAPKKGFDELREERDAIWAEALWLYRHGETLYLDKKDENDMRSRQKERNVNAEDPTDSLLDDFLEAELPLDWRTGWDLHRRRRYFNGNESTPVTEKRTVFSTCEFVCERLFKNMSDPDYRYVASRVNALMREKKGWLYNGANLSGHAHKIYGRQRCWVRVNPDEFNGNDEDL